VSEGRAGAAREHAAVAANARKAGPTGARRAAPSNLFRRMRASALSRTGWRAYWAI